ncbi:MAG TPA: hypothetical protein V6D02_16575 [Candidatus Obscuribacterales bacterium]
MNQSPQIVHLDMLDTDYAKMTAGECISPERQQRLAWSDPAFKLLSRQIARYRYDRLDQEGRDDLLCNMGAAAGLLTPADLEDINDRIRRTGHLYLTAGERQQIFNWLMDELAVDLRVNPDE